MEIQTVCGTCIFFDAIHEMCKFLGRSQFVFEKRRAMSPACWEGYMRKPSKGELTRLFEQNRIPKEWTIPKNTGVSIFPF